MKSTSFFSFILLLLFATSAYAQVTRPDSSSLMSPIENQQLMNTAPADSQMIKADQTTLTVANNKSITIEDTFYIQQVKFGIDVLRLGQNFLQTQSNAILFNADYYLKNNTYIVVEGGVGKGTINYEHLKYTTNSYNIKLGIDKSMIDKIGFSDLDYLFFGFRYGLAVGNISEGQYSISSTLGTPTSGTIPSRNFSAHWGEMNAGIRVEMIKNWYLGWNFRAKFLLNGGTFKEGIKPIYIAGYGAADKATVFDFGIFLQYAIKWVK